MRLLMSTVACKIYRYTIIRYNTVEILARNVLPQPCLVQTIHFIQWLVSQSQTAYSIAQLEKMWGWSPPFPLDIGKAAIMKSFILILPHSLLEIPAHNVPLASIYDIVYAYIIAGCCTPFYEVPSN